MGLLDDIILGHYADGVPAQSPFLETQRPEKLVVPSAVLIALASELLKAQNMLIRRISRIKFQKVLLPETPFEIRFTPGKRSGQITWLSEGNAFAEAQVQIGEPG